MNVQVGDGGEDRAAELPFELMPVEEIEASAIREQAALAELLRTLRRPLLIRGVAGEWPACQRWDLSFLRAHFAGRELPVACSTERIFPGHHGAAIPQGSGGLETASKFCLLPAAEIFDAFEHPPNPYYLSALPLREEGALLTDIPFHAARSGDFAPLLWVSSPGHVTPTHFDANASLFTQVRGCKRFVLFPPAAFSALYPYGVDHPQARYSRMLDLAAPDFERFPAARQLQGIEARVEAGCALLLPAFWWHCVFTREPSVSVTFLLNNEPLPRFAELMGYWAALHQLLCQSLPADLPPEMRAYALRLMLFPPELMRSRADTRS